jgi:hypothetical protein
MRGIDGISKNLLEGGHLRDPTKRKALLLKDRVLRKSEPITVSE